MRKVPSMQELRKKLAKDDHSSEGWYLRYIVRPIGAYIVKLLLYTPITANQVTIIMLFLGLVSAICFTLGHFIIAGVIFWLVHILDVVDGSIARYYNKPSVRGKYLDYIYHSFTQPTILLSMGLGIFLETNIIVYLYLGILSSIFYLSADSLSLYQSLIRITDLKEDYSRVISSANNIKKDNKFGLKQIIVRIGVDIFNAMYFTTMSNIILIGVLIGRIEWVVWFYGLLMPIRLVVLIPYYFIQIPNQNKK